MEDAVVLLTVGSFLPTVVLYFTSSCHYGLFTHRCCLLLTMPPENITYLIRKPNSYINCYIRNF